MSYNPQEIEKKWQKKWAEAELYKAADFDKKPKFFALIEFPYPSGAGLHVGHARSWSAMDAYSRKKRMAGFNVLYPMGWDAFGLPAENYAIKMGKHPSKTVGENIQRFKEQCQNLGLSFDWSREINTTDPQYYKWTQWIFLKLLEKGLAYRAETPVNWCPSCKTTLANEEVLADGSHERCGKPTEKRSQKQWLFKITAYAQRLLDDLNLVDFSPKIRIQQENWIGRSEGATIKFEILNSKFEIKVFTTRTDTIFGVTGLAVAPEHEIISKIKDQILNISEVEDYIAKAKKKSETERTDLTKEKTGVQLKGVFAINPVNQEKIPILVGDYVVANYGGGAVMVVPAHDKRDNQFAKNLGLEIKEVVVSDRNKGNGEVFCDYGTLINSGEFNSLSSQEAISKIVAWLEKRGAGEKTITYHLRDWIFSRQHYWGEPIPVVYCANCAKTTGSTKHQVPITNINGIDYAIIPVPEKDLPVELPYVEKYEPSGTGESPLAKIENWVNVACPECGSAARRETDTMPNWGGSNWYYLGYLLSNSLGTKNEKGKSKKETNNVFEECKKQIKYWMPVDIYQGGFEHTTLHLLYSRFIYKFLYDIGVVPTPEPYAKRRSHGIVLGPDNRKMSKSFGNVVNPDDIVAKYGADTLRLYEMFMGPFDQAISWSEQSLQGCSRFLNRVWQLFENNVKTEKTPNDLLRKLHQTIKKVSEDIEDLKFNTLVASLMEFINDWQDSYLSKGEAELLVRVMAPLAPHIAEEIWTEVLKNRFSIHQQEWPKYDESLIAEEIATIIIQVNGRVRGEIRIENIEAGRQNRIEELAKKDARVAKYLEGKEIKKVIFVPGKLINFVI